MMIHFKKTLLQFMRYFGAALIGYIFDFGTLIILREVFNIHYLIAASIGFTAGLAIVYLLSSRYVFGASKIESKLFEVGIFVLIGVIGLIALNIIMWILTGNLSVNYIVSKIIATIVVYVWNFFARRSLYHEV